VTAVTGGNATAPGGLDSKLVEALEIVLQENKASASYLQRKLGLGYSRAARMIDDMEDAGMIGQARGSKPREVLIANMDEAMVRMESVGSGGSSSRDDDDY